MARVLVRICFALLIVGSTAIVATALIEAPGNVEAWAAIAGSLAVIAALVSAWSAQRVLELQEDALLPVVYPSIDVRSRYGILQLRVTNFGGTPAHNINLKWDRPLRNSEGKEVTFAHENGLSELAVLLPKESVAKTIDGHVHFYAKYRGADAVYSGNISFTASSGKEHRNRFILSADQYAGTPVADEDELRSHYDLQQLPGEIKKISTELALIRQQFGRDS